MLTSSGMRYRSAMRMGYALVALALLGCSNSAKATPTTTTEAAPSGSVPIWEEICPGTDQLVVYRAEGSAGSVSYTVQTPSGTAQGDGVRIPLRESGSTGIIKVDCFRPGEFLYLSVQNENERGTVACVIERDGRQVARVESKGAYVIAQCDA